MINSYATLLKDDEVQRIHEASLEILSEVGLIVRNEKARQRFAHHGCNLDGETGTVKLPAEVVTEFMAMTPDKFTFHGRDGELDKTLPGDGPVIATASSAPNIIDPVSGRHRRALSSDIARIAHLVDQLAGYDVLSVSVLADDAPEGQFSLSRFYPAIKNTKKPVRASVLDRAEAEQVLAMCSLIAGGEEAFRERPFVTFGACSVVAPLAMDVNSTEMLMYYAENSIPAHSITVPNGGLSAPFSLAGTVVQANSEFLAATVLAQMSRPHTPVLYLVLPTLADLRTGAYASGGIENAMMDMAVAQMARFYDLPSGGYIGQTNAKTSDAQAGFEKGMAPIAGVLAGFNYLLLGGLLDALMTFDFGQAVIDSEIAMMLKRVARGMEFSEANLALKVIAEVGPGGMFISHPHTMERMRTTAFLPQIAERGSRDEWIEGGSMDAHARALGRAREILSGANHSVLSAGVDARIRAQFEGLVNGDSTPPEGWDGRPEKPARRVRRRRRKRRE